MMLMIALYVVTFGCTHCVQPVHLIIFAHRVQFKTIIHENNKLKSLVHFKLSTLRYPIQALLRYPIQALSPDLGVLKITLLTTI